MEVDEQNVDDEVHEGENNNVDDEVDEGEDNVEMGDFAVDDGIEDEDKTTTNEENDEISDESEDSEILVDEDNIIPDVEVDMRDFYMNINLKVEFLEKRVTRHIDNESEENPKELDVIHNDHWDSLDEGFDIERKRKVILKELGKDTRCSQMIGQKYKSKKGLKENIQLHALETRWNIFFKKNDKMRLRALCKGTVAFNDGHVGEPIPCPWVIQDSISAVDSPWFIKTYNHEHRCLQTRKSKLFKNNCKRNIKLDSLFTRYSGPISTAKKGHVHGDYKKQYDSTNPDTTPKLHFESEPNPSATSRSFKRMYMCLGGMKKGFRAFLRDFLGFYGAFMKGPFPRQILIAFGVESSNGIYPLTYANIETKNTDSCKWFLECIGDNPDLYANSNFSDRQKTNYVLLPSRGLQAVISQLYSFVEHRCCLRHIHDNMRKTWRTKEYKDHLCNCATTAPKVQPWDDGIQLYKFDHDKSHLCDNIVVFLGRVVSNMLLNNLCEGQAMAKLLGNITEYMMKRICNVIKVKNNKQLGGMGQTNTKCKGYGRINMLLTWLKEYAAAGILNDKVNNGEKVGELHTYAYRVHWLETWKTTYTYKVEPIKGREMWPISEYLIKITPPLHHNQSIRPKKKRKQFVEEKARRRETMVLVGVGVKVMLLVGVESLQESLSNKCKSKGYNARSYRGGGGGGGGKKVSDGF
uniref:MULE transposase domain-containing protein n=1 Tax=Lactuca sativa TaxID=4236 RepID=A0A9R1VJI7_LACSA|nr:hypothetical protein LSAT_V11C500257980 [Lactuca sativa]